MAISLLRITLIKFLHIATFWAVCLLPNKMIAQSVLLPGDVVIVTANADTNAFDFIPLINIEKNTTLFFSDGIWDDENRRLHGDEITVTFEKPVSAGSKINVSENSDNRISVSGKLNMDSERNRIFAYQKEEAQFRFIYGVGWGKRGIWNKKLPGGSDIPPSLTETEYTLLTLGDFDNFHYYIRNGASGTKNMLLKFVGNSQNWEGRNKHPFLAFGTSFNLLKPPVVIFENSITSVNESDDKVEINISIFEHDGSRLKVDVVYDSLRSITGRTDIGFTETTINFTGLVGDGVYEVEIPIRDNNEFENRETGIFTLQNLTKGSLGDFYTHSLIISDDELPNVGVTGISNTFSESDFIELKNYESIPVSLKGWTITHKENTFTFGDDAVLFPDESLRLIENQNKNNTLYSGKSIFTDVNDFLIDADGGELILSNVAGEEISRMIYPKAKKKKNSGSKDEFIVAGREESITGNINKPATLSVQSSTMNLNVPGWKVLPNIYDITGDFPNVDFFYWDESAQKFEKLEPEDDELQENEVLVGKFDVTSIGDFLTWSESIKNKTKDAAPSALDFTLSATDKNESETLDRLEGFNLVFNSLNTAIPVHVLLAELSKARPEVEFKPYIYGLDVSAAAGIKYVSLSGADKIRPKSPFWIVLDNLQSEISFSLDETLLASNAVFEKQIVELSSSGIELSMSNKDVSTNLDIEFGGDKSAFNIKDIQSYPEFFLPSKEFLNVSVEQDSEYFNKVHISDEEPQNISLPIILHTSESGTFDLKVTEWRKIPGNWKLVLEDKLDERTYILNQNFTFTFTHSSKFSPQNSESVQQDSALYNLNNRFILNINPVSDAQNVEEEVNELPKELELHQNYPNPFNPITTISFYLPEPAKVKLSVFNIVGQPVAVIMDGTLSKGHQQFDWDATDRPSGMYIYQLEVGNRILTRKMTLVK